MNKIGKNLKSKNRKEINYSKKNKISRIIKILFILILSYIYYKKKTSIKSNKLVIQVDISKSKQGKDGPIILQRGISKALPYETKYCKFIPANGILQNMYGNYIQMI